MIQAKKRITLAVISAIGLLNILLIPFSGGGLFPDDFEPQFFDMLEYFGDAAEYAPAYLFAISYLLPLFIFLSGIFMLIAALVGKKGLCVGAGITGLSLWLIPFIIFFADASDMGADFEDIFEALFDGDNGAIAIGTILALILFIVYLCISCSSAKQIANNNPYQQPVAQQYNPYQQTPYQNNYQAPVQNGYQAPVENNYQAPTEPAPAPEAYSDITSNATAAAPEATVANPENKFCPECGTQAKADAMFCGSCGHKF